MDTTPHRIARRQHGVVARHQLLAAGLPARRVDLLVRDRVLHVAARGVYRVPGIDRDGLTEPMTAVLRCGPGARVGGERLLAALGVPVPPLRARLPLSFRVLVPAADRVPASQVWHVVPDRHPRLGESTTVAGLPTWTVGRNLLEAAAGAVDARRVEELVTAVATAAPAALDELASLAAAAPGHPGVASLTVAGALPGRVLVADDGGGFATSAARRWGSSVGGHTLAAPPPPTPKVLP